MRYTTLFFSVILLWSLEAQSQTSTITVENIWTTYKYFGDYSSGYKFMKDGKHYTAVEGSQLIKYDITTGEKTEILFDGKSFDGEDGFAGSFGTYVFSAEEDLLLLATGTESIYRHSSRSVYYIFNIDKKELTKLFDGPKQMYATFSPYGDAVAFVVDNNVYVRHMDDGRVEQVTSDGAYGHIINGAVDWVYEEEFSMDKGYTWNVDGSKLAYYKFNESEVPNFIMKTYTTDLYPKNVEFKYPKVGEVNSKVSVHIYDLKEKEVVDAELPARLEYLPRMKWTQDKNTLSVQSLNRWQNNLGLWFVKASNGKTKLVMEDRSDYYVDVDDHLSFTEDGRHFIWSSEKDGYQHLYLYDMNGEEIRRLTKGQFDVTDYYGLDWINNELYYQAAVESPLRREIYKISYEGGKPEKISKEPGWYDIQFSTTFDYYIENFSTINSPAIATIKNRSGEIVRTLYDNQTLRTMQEHEAVNEIEFFDMIIEEGERLNGYWLKPDNFDESKKYPLFMYLYGGPNSQKVKDQWFGQNYWWFQMLADMGYVVACVDNRGTGARGEKFRKMTYTQLGHFETKDQIAAAKYLGGLPYIDEERIGVFGWSYGGYLSTLCLLKGNDVFDMAIAVAPVTNWKWYDNIYTERFMKTYAENAAGYDQNSPVFFADQLRGDYLLVHGGSDDNVHVQHSMEMANALIQANKQFDFYIYPNDNHGIYFGNARRHLYEKMTSFILEKL